MARVNFDAMTKTQEFSEWFWKKQGGQMNGARVIKHLNNAATGTRKVRYEEHGPCIYAIIMKPKITIETNDGPKKMRLIKVGFTHIDTAQDNPDSRMNTVMDAITRKMTRTWKIEVSCSVWFVLRIDALDTRCFFDIEAEIRRKVGIVVPKNIGKALHLPVHTEWVVTTGSFIYRVNEQKEPQKPKNPGTQQETPPSTKMSKSTQEVTKAPGACNTVASTGESTPPKARRRLQMSEIDDLTKRMQDTHVKAAIDTDTVFGGLKFDAHRGRDNAIGVSDSFYVIKAYKADEVNVKVIERDSGNKYLHLAKSKKSE
jgi:hypothetical protein